MKIETLFIQGLNREITFYIGRNKNENFEVIDEGTPNDLWFHANEVSSCHIVANVPIDITSKEKKYIIKTGAILCKKYTNKLKTSNNVEVIYTEIKNVEKTQYSGCVKIKNSKTIIV